MFAKGPQPGHKPKANTLAREPKAYAHHWIDGWVIYNGTQLPNKVIGHGKNAYQAWRDAEAATTMAAPMAGKEQK